MPFIQAETRAGRTLIVEQYQASRFNIKNTPRLPSGEMSEAHEKANARREVRELTIKINANFNPGDYHLVLDYASAERPQKVADAKEDRNYFLRRLRYLSKKAGLPLKYIIVTEWGSRGGGLHHHLVINKALDTELIRKIWKKGRVHFNSLDDKGDYSELAAYLLKTRAEFKRRGGSGRQWSGSRNLIRPVTHKKVIRMDTYYNKPKPRKGYILNPDSEKEGFTKDGFPYRSCVFIKVSRGNDP